MASSAARVFGTYELLECILASLPPNHALKVQPVCKTWNSMIQTSKTIRQLCFFDLEGKPIQPFASEALLYDGPMYYDQPVPNPLLLSMQRDKSGFWRDSISYCEAPCVRTTIWFPVRVFKSLPSTSSHREMYLTQPPCTTVLVVIGKRPLREFSPITKAVTYRDNHGVKLGGVQDFAMEILETWFAVGFVDLCEARVRLMVWPPDER